MRTRPAPTLISAALLAGCAATAPDAPEDLRPLLQVLASSPDGVAARVPPRPDAALAPGDGVAFEVALETGSSRRTWRLCVDVDAVTKQKALDLRGEPVFARRVQPSAERRREIAAREAASRRRIQEQGLGPIDLFEMMEPVPIAKLRVEAFDGDDASVGVAESSVITGLLERGLLDACRAGHRQRDRMAGRVAAGHDAELLTLDDAAYDDVQAASDGVAACFRFVRILRENPVTREIMFEVLALPSLWSILTNWGVRLSFEVDFFAAERLAHVPPEWAGRELWTVPMIIRLNDQPGLIAQLVVGPSGSPHGAVAGVHGLVARHPTDAGRRLVVRLLGSRRGGS